MVVVVVVAVVVVGQWWRWWQMDHGGVVVAQQCNSRDELESRTTPGSPRWKAVHRAPAQPAPWAMLLICCTPLSF